METLAEVTGLDPEGVRHAHPDIPVEFQTTEAVEAYGQVLIETASARTPRPGKTIKHVIYGMLRRPKKQEFDTVRTRIAKAHEAADIAKKSGADRKWDGASDALKAIPGAHETYLAWCLSVTEVPSPESAGYLTAHDRERDTRAAMLTMAETAVGHQVEAMRAELEARLAAADMHKGSLVWKRAWNHHWARLVAKEVRLEVLVEAQA